MNIKSDNDEAVFYSFALAVEDEREAQKEKHDDWFRAKERPPIRMVNPSLEEPKRESLDALREMLLIGL